MKKRKGTLPFKGTPEQEAKLMQVIEAHKGEDGALMPVMQEAQEIYGYLPIEVQQMIAKGLSVPVEKVYGVATFYSRFTLTPKGKYNIQICLGTACYVKGADKVLAKLEEILGIKAGETTSDGKFSIEAARCVGACGLAPVMVINEEVYGKVTPDMVKEILNKYE